MAYDDYEDKSFKIDENYFKVIIPDLDPGKDIPVEFRWQYSDNKYSEWSVAKILSVPQISRPEVENVVAVWDGTTLKITWDKTSNLANSYQIYLTNGGTTMSWTKGIDKNQTSQSWTLSEADNIANFNNVFRTSFTGFLKTTYIDNTTTGVAFTTPTLADSLTNASISDASWSITAVDDGSIIAWDKIENSFYLETEVWKSDTQNGTYIGAGGSTNAPVKVKHISDVWIKIRHRTKGNTYTAYSNSKQASRYDPLFEDVTPPNSATVNSVVWSGSDIIINYTMPASDPPVRFKTTLTNGLYSGTFYDFASAPTGTFNLTITDARIYQQLGQRFSSYSGLLESIDGAGNSATAVPFTVPVRSNPGAGITPTFTLTGITNGYAATWSAPNWVEYTKVYEGTSAGFTPNDSTNLVYSGPSPAIIKTLGRTDPFGRKYIKIKYFGSFIGDESEFFSAEQFVDPIDALTADINAPDAPSAGLTASTGIDTTGTMGFNGFINLAWNAVSDTTLRGYRIRFRPYKALAPFENYSYVDSPGTGTSYRLAGLAVGATYEVAIASYDEYNNTSSAYTSYSNQTISGTPAMSNFITAGVAGFQFGSGIKDKTGAANASAQGLYLSNSNYWYLTAADAAQFKIGGSATNYVEWDGALLKVDGDLGVAGGTTIGGNISMKNSGASIYAGTLSGTGALNSDGFMLNYGGLAARKTFTVNGQSVIKEVRLQTNDGIYADYGQIAGWTIDTDRIERGTGGTGNLYAGLSSTGTYSFWAGSTGSKGNSSAKFLVTPGGQVTSRAMTIIADGSSPLSKIIDAGPFFVRNDGYLEASGAKITGEINATTGKISGKVTIGSVGEPDGYLQVLAGSGFLEVGYGLTKSGNAYYGIQAGSISGSTRTNKFEVNALTGEMTAVGGGNIGGWTIGTTELSAGTGASYVAVSAGGTDAFWAGNATASSAPFRVTSAGVLTATGATIRGTLRASAGGFGTYSGDTLSKGWLINAATIESTGAETTTGKVILDGENGAISGGKISGTKVLGSAFYIGSSESATDYIKSDGTFSLGGGKITGSSSSVTIAGASLVLAGLSGGDDGTAGDPTVTSIINPAGLGGIADGRIVTGRAIWYGGNNTPTSSITSRYAFNNTFGGSQGYVGGVPRYTSANPGNFSTGDLYMTIV